MTLTSLGPAAPGYPLSGAALDGTDLILVSRNLSPTRLAVVDTGSWAVTREITIQRGDGAFATTTAPDGVYVGLFGARGQGNMLRVEGSTLRGRAAISAQLPWDLASDDGPLLYGVATEPSIVFSIDRATGRATDLGVVTSPAERPRTCTIAGDRVVFAGAVGGRAWLRHTARDGRDPISAVPPALAEDDILYASATLPDGRIAVTSGGPDLDTPAVAIMDLDDPASAMVVRLPREALVDTVTCVGTQVYVTARPSGALYRIDGTTGELYRIAVPVPMSETRELFVIGGRLAAASADGSVWTHQPATGVTEVHTPAELGLVRRPQRPQSIVAAAGRTDVGGSFSVTRHDLDSGTARSVFVPGEPKAMVDVRGTSYLAMYPIAEIWSWPAADPGPRRLTQLPTAQLRPISLVHVPQLDALVTTTTNDRETSGLHTIDPVTGRVDTVLDPLGPGQTASGLHVVGTTCYVGGSGRSPAVAAYDLLTGQRLWQVADLVPGGSFVLGLAVVGNTLLCTTVTGWAVRVDLTSRVVVQRRRVSQEAGRLAVTTDRVLLATADALLRIDPVTLGTTVEQDNLDAQVWGWPPLAVGPLGRAWLVAGRDLVRT